jgi:hypothetical protein
MAVGAVMLEAGKARELLEERDQAMKLVVN